MLWMMEREGPEYNMTYQRRVSKESAEIIILTTLIIGVTYISYHNYLLFHSVIELISIIVAFSISLIALATYQITGNNLLTFFGIAYGFIGGIDLLHTLAYDGMGVFPGNTANLSTQLWIAARYTESVSIAFAPLFFYKSIKNRQLFGIYCIFVTILLLSIFKWNVFPDSFIVGTGLTLFKKISEILISLLIIIGIITLVKSKKMLEPKIFRFIIFSYITTIVSEFSFIIYIDVFGLSNMIGHLFKLISFYFIFKAIIQSNLLIPYQQLSLATKELEKEVKERKEHQKRFQKIFDFSAIGKALVLPEGRFLAINSAFCKFTGYSEAELLTMKIQNITHPDDLHNTSENRRRLLIGETNFYQVEKRCITKSGEAIWGLITVSVIRDVNGSPLYTINAIQDITKQKKMQEEMCRLESFNLLGTMAAGINHEIRNPMTTVRGFLQMLGEKTDLKQYKKYFAIMIEELDRANSIITEYLSLSKNTPTSPKLTNLNSIIEALAPLINADALKKGRQLKLNLVQLSDQMLHEIEIRQLILNLCNNGLEAMSIGGVLTLSTFEEKDYIVLAVQDEGEGIDPLIQEKLGTPFFTTKDNGTGLGLTICYNIASKHNAKIKVKTSHDGTIFYVKFQKNEVIKIADFALNYN